jgi:hypothetical protein
MDTCGEHGDDIAYAGNYCPACSEIEDLKKEHQQEIDTLREQFQDDLEELRSGGLQEL